MHSGAPPPLSLVLKRGVSHIFESKPSSTTVEARVHYHLPVGGSSLAAKHHPTPLLDSYYHNPPIKNQAVRVDPWDGLGSLSQPLGDGGPVVALACHPSRPIVAACLSDGTISLWDYDSADGRGSGRFSGGSGGGGSGWGVGGGGGGDVAGSGDGYMGSAPGAGMGSPTLSPPPKGVRGSSKAGRDEKCVEGFRSGCLGGLAVFGGGGGGREKAKPKARHC